MLFKDSINVLHIETYECDICHQVDVLQESCYVLEIEGKKRVACGKCYRQAMRIEDDKR